MTHYFFDAGIFLSHPWASNTLSAGVPVPAPVPAFAGGGGGGVWPAWRIKDRMDKVCDDFVKEIARKYCPDPDQKEKKINPYPAHLESLIKKQVPGKEYTDKKRIKDLQKRITILEERIRELKKEAEDKKRENKERIKSAKRMRRLGVKVRSLLVQLQGMFARLEAKEAELAAREEEVERRELKVQEQLAKIDEKVEAIPYNPELERLKLVIEERQRIIAGVKAAIPWAAGSVAVYLGTEYLVPEEERLFRFLGYAASGALVVTALVEGFSVYQEWDRTAADRG